MNKTPKLRFKEFSGDWESKKLGNLLEFKNGINASKEQYGHGEKFINVLDILNNNYITHENIIGKVDVDKSTFEKYSVGYGDVVFQRSSETREEVGTANVYLDKDNKATFGGFIIRGKKIGEYDPIFMNKLLKSSTARKEITTKSGGSTRYNVGQDTLSDVSLLFPKLEEQEKIASFFSLIDDKISLQSEKIEALKDYKKGMMQKLFNRELRFKDDEGRDYPEWEEKKLGDISNLTSSKRVFASDYVDKGVPFYRGKEITELKQNKKPKDILYITQERYNDIKQKFGIPVKGDLLLTAVGTLGNSYVINDNEPFYFKDGNLIWFRDIKEDVNFLNFILTSENGKKKIIDSSIGSTQKALTIVELNKLKYKFPCLDEQRKISNFLNDLEKRVMKEEEKLDFLNEYKKGLLQQMFV
ncbi:type IC HsdS subunit [[Clostridium] sordellii]|uniref:restriction endonuclease subunit S n=1 Tax=Paraclostridium sordellii TaxID=1505 RepID=UPI0005DAAEA6|nr:restriction endonuclease subunit S [Paeniclostridium sordellii]CEO06886.1 type IC HsdS subunit [[Clostridium] sordellii] [Paeniclostridium sordellii]CEP86704.1 type IC HsdS subunit [[Clostridium] sordellii] [Paeniclostridium sordellii]